MKKIIYSILGLALLLNQYSCTDESTFNNPATNDLEVGAFAKFEDGSSIPGILFEPQQIDVSANIIDAGDNIIEYALQLNASIGGTAYFEETLLIVTSFPATINITSQTIADAIGISVNDISFGDSFTFSARVTREDGTVFYGIQPTYDEDNGTVGVGNTEGQLFLGSYNNAMRFVIALACPPSPAGVYRVEMFDDFGDGWQTNAGNDGDGIQITIDDDVIEVGLCSRYNGSQGEFCVSDPNYVDGTNTMSEGTDFVTIPDGAEVVLWEFPGDRYGEIRFNIYDPNGDLIGSYGNGTPAGLLILCDGDLGS